VGGVDGAGGGGGGGWGEGRTKTTFTGFEIGNIFSHY